MRSRNERRGYPCRMVRSRLTLQAIDLHCGGEPLRLITAGFPPVPRAPILERRRWVRTHADHVRRVAMYEPRGHRDMYGAVLLPPYRDDADVAVLFMHNEGWSTMCGHGTIAITRALVEEGLFLATPPETTIRFEAPAGLVTATARDDEASFENVPAYLAGCDLRVHPDGWPELTVDLAFGGAYYGIVDAAALGLRVVPGQLDALTRAGAAINAVLRRDHAPTHPTEPDLGFVYGTIIVDRSPATAPDGLATHADIRNVTIFADAEVDRSPCGSGTSALLAQAVGRGRLGPGDEIANASITGSVFRGRVDGLTTLGKEDAVRTTISGSAYVTGFSTFVVDERDELGEGFLLR